MFLLLCVFYVVVFPPCCSFFSCACVLLDLFAVAVGVEVEVAAVAVAVAIAVAVDVAAGGVVVVCARFGMGDVSCAKYWCGYRISRKATHPLG